MSGEDTFIARWSRLKRQTVDEKRPAGAKDRQTSDSPPEPASAARDAPKPMPAEPPFDLASLPPIESIGADTDIYAFLQEGVPAALTKAALRRAWTTDPAIRDFIEMAENQWDFTDPTAIPGFGPLRDSDDIGQLARQAMGKLQEQELPEAAGPTEEGGRAVAGAAPEGLQDPQPGPPARGGPDKEGEEGEVVAAATQHRVASTDGGQPVETVPRRRGHGSAMPK